MAVDILDGVLHGHDVALALVVEAIDDAGQGRGLAGTGGTGDEYETLLEPRKDEDLLGDVEVVGVWQAEGDDADNGTGRAPLAEDVGAETSQARNREREVVVVLVVFREVGELAIGENVDLLHQIVGVGRHQALRVGAILLATLLIGQLEASDDEDVRCIVVDHVLQDFFEVHSITPTRSSQNPSTTGLTFPHPQAPP